MNQTFQISLNELGRILIPASLRQRLGLKPGMTLVVEEAEQEQVQLRVLDESAGLVEKDGLLIFTGEIDGDITNVVKEARERRAQELVERIGL
jgi:AbrB family looped-hinge helix DNA binding protein